MHRTYGKKAEEGDKVLVQIFLGQNPKQDVQGLVQLDWQDTKCLFHAHKVYLTHHACSHKLVNSGPDHMMNLYVYDSYSRNAHQLFIKLRTDFQPHGILCFLVLLLFMNQNVVVHQSSGCPQTGRNNQYCSLEHGNKIH